MGSKDLAFKGDARAWKVPGFEPHSDPHKHTKMKVITTILTVLALTTLAVNAQEKGKGKAKASPEEFFKKKDANGDGKLSKEEFLKGAPADKADAMGKRFTALDKDKDGSVSLDEFKAAPAGKGKGKAPASK